MKCLKKNWPDPLYACTGIKKEIVYIFSLLQNRAIDIAIFFAASKFQCETNYIGNCMNEKMYFKCL